VSEKTIVRILGKHAAGVFAVAPLLYASAALAQAAPDRPDEVYTGCEDDAVITDSGGSPRERILSAAGQTDPVTERVFRSFSLDEVGQLGAPEFDALCWSRLDGVWSEQMRVSFDKSIAAEGWAAESPSMLEFAHGNYTTPLHLFVEQSGGYESEIVLRSALGPGEPVRFTSDDGVDIADVFRSDNVQKIYRSQSINGQSETLVLDVTRTGYVRLRLGDRIFLRPRPDISKNARTEQAPANDIFAIAYNPKNLRASRHGYDVTFQDPNRFMDNGGKLDVFAPPEPRDYYISEQMTVPLGLKLIEEGSQGTVFYERLMSSESEIQESTQSSFGFNAGISNERRVKAGEAAQSAGGGSPPRKLGASIGSSNAKGQFNAMRESNAVSSITGFQRYKRYALVRDYPFSNLSDDFVDAVDDARRDGDYQRLIDTFGTHYAYAVTYGSAGHLVTHITEQALSQNFGSFEQNSQSGGLTLGPAEFSATKQSSKDIKQGNSVTNRFGKTTFSAVGGNGSWSEAGFMAGDVPYPILMDLRPLDELINPMNFPGEPDVYERVRDELADAIADYLEGKAQLVNTQSLIDGFDPKERWTLKFTTVSCKNAGGMEPDQVVDLSGSLTVGVKTNTGGVSAKPMTVMRGALNVNCRNGTRSVNASQTITGRRADLAGLSFTVNANMNELDDGSIFDPHDDMKGHSNPVRVPDSASVPIGGVVKGAWKIPHSDGADVSVGWLWKREQ
jgi:hypothetical protein